MIAPKGSCPVISVPHMKGGEGEMIQEHLVSAAEMGGAGRLFARAVLKPGCSVGSHTHQGDMEVCYFLSGRGFVVEDGRETAVSAGDLNVVRAGENHEIRNPGPEDLVYLAVVLFPNGKP